MTDDLEIQHGHTDLDTTSAAQFLMMVQGMFDTAPPNTDPYFEVDFADKDGFLRTARIYPVIDEYETKH